MSRTIALLVLLLLTAVAEAGTDAAPTVVVTPGDAPGAEVEVPTILHPDNAGRWVDLPDGERVWRLRLHAPEARALSLRFSAFQLPPGATLLLLDDDGVRRAGPFTARQNPSDGRLEAGPVPGAAVTLELRAPREGARAVLVLSNLIIGRGPAAPPRPLELTGRVIHRAPAHARPTGRVGVVDVAACFDEIPEYRAVLALPKTKARRHILLERVNERFRRACVAVAGDLRLDAVVERGGVDGPDDRIVDVTANVRHELREERSP